MFETLVQLRPWEVDGHKVRFGNQNTDGGYVVLPHLLCGQPVLSFGVGGDVSFDLELARRGHQVFQFDHTIEDLPAHQRHELFTFTREGVAAVDLPDEKLFSIPTFLERFDLNGKNLIFKMDIEGYEWDVIDSLDESVLKSFDFILMEIHRFGILDQKDVRQKIKSVLSKIASSHTLYHANAHNAAPIASVCGFPIPELLEVCYVRTDLVERRNNEALFPRPQDSINTSQKHFIPLLMFPFAPMPAKTWDGLNDYMDVQFDLLASQFAVWNGPEVS